MDPSERAPHLEVAKSATTTEADGGFVQFVALLRCPVDDELREHSPLGDEVADGKAIRAVSLRVRRNAQFPSRAETSMEGFAWVMAVEPYPFDKNPPLSLEAQAVPAVRGMELGRN